MNNPALSTQLTLEPNDSQRLAKLCGQFDEHLRQIERRLGVRIKNRGNRFQFDGIGEAANKASAVIDALYRETAGKTELTAEHIHLQLQEAGIVQLMAQREAMRKTIQETLPETMLEAMQETPKTMQGATNQSALPESSTLSPATITNAPDASGEIKTRRKTLRPRGENQQRYIAAIRNNDINFAVGPAGTGKTWLAVASAVEALENNRVERILLVRPAVEAGEKLGFLPGDLAQKIDPYLRPLYDALYEMLGVDLVGKLIERNTIEIAPLAFMRGRTLNNSFVILDESQNTTREQMKMFLTRIGFGSTAVVTGDDTQIDLPDQRSSGLLHVEKVLGNIDGITFTHFNSSDVVRHPLVQRIVEAYAAKSC